MAFGLPVVPHAITIHLRTGRPVSFLRGAFFTVVQSGHSRFLVGFDVGSAGSSSMTAAEAPSLNTGYARIQAEAGKVLPAGMAIFSYRSGGVLVSEASVPAMPLMSSGRIYAEVGGTTRTGIAIVNPNAAAVTIDFISSMPMEPTSNRNR